MSQSTSARNGPLPEYAAGLDAFHRAFEPELTYLVGELPIRPADRILDVPCGDGFYSRLLAARLGPQGQVVGLDLLPAYLEEARRRHKRIRLEPADQGSHEDVGSVEFREGNIYELPFEDDGFDLVWCAQSLMSLERPVDGLREVHRVLKPGGVIALLEDDDLHRLLLPWPAELELAVQEALRRAYKRHFGDSEALNMGRHLRRLLREARFDSLTRHTFTSDRQHPLSDDERQFLELYLQSLASEVAMDLAPHQRDQLNRLIQPESDAYLLDAPDFEMTCVDILRIGFKPIA